MTIEELEALKKSLCEGNTKRIEKLEGRLWWFNTLAFANLLAFVFVLLKEVLLK